MTEKNLPSKTIETLFGNIKQLIEEARNTAYRAANFAMVQAYWNIGRLIVEEEQSGKERAEYGKALLEELAGRLTEQYGKSFSNRNLRHMRQFYRVFPKWNALRSELSWTHYRLLLKVEKEHTREFYLNEAIESNWSTRQLERQINSFYYERLLSSKTKSVVKQDAESKNPPMHPSDIIKDPYVLEFLNLKDNADYQEVELESALIEKLQDFLLELGKGFSFVGRQYRISTPEGDHFYIDLIFYNYILKCFLIIDLKVGKLTPQDVGQLDFYVNYIEDNLKQPGDNPTIGLILCSEKNKTVVKYSLQNKGKQLFASKYKLYMPEDEELKREIDKEREIIETEKRLQSPEQ